MLGHRVKAVAGCEHSYLGGDSYKHRWRVQCSVDILKTLGKHDEIKNIPNLPRITKVIDHLVACWYRIPSASRTFNTCHQEWIEQQKRIHSDLEHHIRELSASWAASKFEPTHAWVVQKDCPLPSSWMQPTGFFLYLTEVWSRTKHQSRGFHWVPDMIWFVHRCPLFCRIDFGRIWLLWTSGWETTISTVPFLHRCSFSIPLRRRCRRKGRNSWGDRSSVLHKFVLRVYEYVSM